MYKNEASFSGALIRKLGDRVPVVQRIESGTTGVGIPDIYLRAVETEQWVELKNDAHKKFSFPYMVEWRRGQQAWAHRYYQASKRPVITIVAIESAFLWVPMVKVFKENTVNYDDVTAFGTLSEVYNEILKILLI
jgi:hypothetical protein